MNAPGETISELADVAVVRFGDRPALVDGGMRLTYRELVEAADHFAAALVALGVEPADRVAVWAFNCAQWVIALLGLTRAGATLVPVNTRFKGVEASDLLARSRARVLVTVTDFLGTDYVALLAAAGVELPDLQTTVVISGPTPGGAVSWTDFLAGGTAGAVREVHRRRRELGGDDVSDILFTSGTTGIPKGVVMTHGRTLRVAHDWVEMTGLEAGDRYLMINPYFHMFGLKAGILASMAAGALMLPDAVFDVERVLDRVARERVTVLPGPPTLYQSILDAPDRDAHDLSSLRVAVTGAADIPVPLIRRMHDELPFSTVITGYGLTEAGTATGTGPDDDPDAIATTVGRPRPGFEIRIDRGGPGVAEGEPGEVLLRGASVMSHYLDDPAATATALSPDGWLRTGDLGVVDDAGRLRIVGRSKDMIIVGGFNAYPAEIENALVRHPGIVQAAVIGVPDERLGEVVMAFVVTSASTSTSEPRIIEWCRGQMANYKVPRAVEFVDALPLNATGKVQKDVLRTLASRRPTVSA
jgi:HIP---CoA ligase